MKQMSSIPFSFGWYSWDLGEYRPFPVKYTMYWLFPYKMLPPLPALDLYFTFLISENSSAVIGTEPAKYQVKLSHKIDSLVIEAAQLGLTLPETFIRFMRSPELQSRIRSGTGCWFSLSNRLIQCPGFKDGYLVGFLRDQQDCVIWCLCLMQDGNHCVLALSEDAVLTLPANDIDALYGDLEDVDDSEDIESSETATESNKTRDTSLEVVSVINDIHICAQSFEAFICRFWIEDEIGWKLTSHDKTPLTAWEQRYLAHYAKQQNAET